MRKRKLIQRLEALTPLVLRQGSHDHEVSVDDTICGESNRAHIARFGSMRILVKENAIASKDEDFFRNEYDKLKALEPWCISPRALAYDDSESPPILLIEYIEGEPLTENTVVDYWSCIVDILNKMANVPVSYLYSQRCFRQHIKECFSYARMILEYASTQLSTYRSRVGNNNLALYLERCIRRCDSYLNSHRRLFVRSRMGLIHTGLHPANLIASGDRLSVIDWEHANIGDRAFELSGLLRKAHISKDHIRYLLSEYHGGDADLRARSHVYSQVFRLHEVLWHAIRKDMAEQGELQLSADKTPEHYHGELEAHIDRLREAEYAL